MQNKNERVQKASVRVEMNTNISIKIEYKKKNGCIHAK